MSTSGSTDLILTAREVITFALKKIRVLDPTETASAEDAEDAMLSLNLMLKSWQKHENLWRLTEGSQALASSDVDYALSPVPFRVVSARYRNTDGTDLLMRELTREEYYNLPQKTTTGIPTQYYIDYQRAAVTMYVWQCLSAATTETIKYTFIRKFEDVDSLDNEIDVRQEHLELVGLNLAARLADDHGRTGESINRVIARAEVLLQEFLDDDREDEVRFVPGYR